MSEDKKRKEKLKEVVKGLKSKDEKEVVKSIKALKVYGDASAAPQIFNLLLQHKDNAVEAEVLQLLASLKDTDMPPVLINAVEDDQYLEIRQKLLASMWQSGLNYSDYLLNLVKVALKGDFMIQVECITIIENLEGPFKEEHLMESLLLLNNFFEQDVKDERKSHLMKDLILIIKDYQV